MLIEVRKLARHSFMKILFCLWLLFLAAASNGQKIVEAYQSQAGSLKIGVGKKDYQRYNEKGYTLVVPDTIRRIQGILISLRLWSFPQNDL